MKAFRIRLIKGDIVTGFFEITGKSNETGYKPQVLEQTHRGDDFTEDGSKFKYEGFSLESDGGVSYSTICPSTLFLRGGGTRPGIITIIDIPDEETCNRIIDATVAYNHKHGTGDLGTMEIKVIGTTWTVG